ncbi:hypothetical protein K432DRAFT_387478, partial [Lepidopterella palustris CBS 459.81]
MTDPFSIAIGALSAFEMILKAGITVYDGINTAKTFGKDSAWLIRRLNAERVIAEELKKFLFGENCSSSAEINQGLENCFFNGLPKGVQIAISDSLRQSNRVIVAHSGLDKYGFVSKATDPMVDKALIDGDEKKKQHSATALEIATWTLKDGRKARIMVDEFTECIALVDHLVRTCLLVETSSASLRRLEEDRAANALGIAKDARMRRIVTAEEVPTDIKVIELQDHGQLRLEPRGGSTSLTEEILNGERVLVESVDYPLDPDGRMGVPSLIQERLSKLAALLQAEKPLEFRCLKSSGWIHQASKQRFLFVYEYPIGETFNFYFSLDRILREKSKKMKPTLDARLALAYQLAKAIQNIHMVGWVHKGLRSSNVLFFNSEPLDTLKECSFQDPNIFGFEYARPLQNLADSAMETDLNIERNVYRHPDRWGKPHEHFEKKHDLYALGVILLEVGLWESVFSFQSSSFSNWTEEPQKVKERILLHANRLGFYTGERYRDIVLCCLDPHKVSLQSSELQNPDALDSIIAETLRNICQTEHNIVIKSLEKIRLGS